MACVVWILLMTCHSSAILRIDCVQGRFSLVRFCCNSWFATIFTTSLHLLAATFPSPWRQLDCACELIVSLLGSCLEHKLSFSSIICCNSFFGHCLQLVFKGGYFLLQLVTSLLKCSHPLLQVENFMLQATHLCSRCL